MNFLQALSFTTPLALAALLLLPVIWWLLRFTPPRPETVKFPPIRLLLDLVNREEQPDKTPWWLMLLRLAVAPSSSSAWPIPSMRRAASARSANAPLLLVVDDTWAAAKDWNKRQEIMAEILDSAAARRRHRDAGHIDTAAPPASAWNRRCRRRSQTRAAALEPRAIDPDRAALLQAPQRTTSRTPAPPRHLAQRRHR